MDRCRCAEYEAAVKKLRFYTVGTLRPDIVDNYDRTGYLISWTKNGINLLDQRFVVPRVRQDLKPHQLPGNQLSVEARRIEQMWCPFMTPYEVKVSDEN